MPRKSKKSYNWFGGGEHIVPKDDAVSTSADVIQMIPPIQTVEVTQQRGEMLIEAIYLHFSVVRLDDSALTALGFVVYQGEVTEGGNLPSQALNALPTTNREYSNKRIMVMAPLPIPPILVTDMELLTTVPDLSVLVAHHEYQAMRKHNRSNTILCMAVNTQVDDALEVFCQWRVLASW